MLNPDENKAPEEECTIMAINYDDPAQKKAMEAIDEAVTANAEYAEKESAVYITTSKTQAKGLGFNTLKFAIIGVVVLAVIIGSLVLWKHFAPQDKPDTAMPTEAQIRRISVISTETFRNADGEKEWYVEYEYDEEGLPEKVPVYVATDGESPWKLDRYYELNGNSLDKDKGIITRTYIGRDADGEENGKILQMRYSTKLQLISITNKDAEDGSKEWMQFDCGQGEREDRVYTDNNKLKSIIRYTEFDEAGNVIIKEEYNTKDELIGTHEYAYVDIEINA